MSTIGHPLSDLSNLLWPYEAAARRLSTNPHPEFVHGATPGLPSHQDCIRWYAEVAGWDPSADQKWGAAFNGFRSCVIIQGIAARYALRQASSEKALDYAQRLGPYGEYAWGLVRDLIEEGGSRAKL